MTKYGQNENVNSNSGEISLKDIIVKLKVWYRYLISKWLIIIIFALLGGVLGAYYATTKKPVYTATTTFVLEDERAGAGIGNLAGLASMAGFDLGASGGGGIFEGDNILELYKSRKMVTQTLFSEINEGRKELLIDRYIYFNKLRSNWETEPGLDKLIFKADSLSDGTPILKPNRIRDSIINQIVNDITKNYLSVGKPDKKLSIIRVEVKSRDEIFAKAFNESIVKNVNYFYKQTKTKKALQNVQIMQSKTDSVRAVMNGAIYSSVAIADATPNLNPTRQVQRAAPAQRAQFSAETNKAILSSLVQNLEMSKLTLMKQTPLLEILDEPLYPLDRITYSKITFGIVGAFLSAMILVIFYGLKLYLKEDN